jgi:DNA-binding winged helix-turn-helix (wHTH) protein/tetratricopeptide (TPR) repeat protein
MLNSPSTGGIRIGDCTLDLSASQLLRNGTPVHVRAKTFAVLRHLALNAGRVIGKDELFDTLWPGLAVTEDTLTQSIRELRVALGPEGATALRTVARRGFVLDLPPPVPGSTETGVKLPLVVILPFAVTSPEATDGALTDGLIEEVTHATACYGQIRVMARHSAFQFRPDTSPPAEAARKLGTDYFVEGTARRIGAELHLSPALCDTATGRQIWGETFRLSPDNFLEAPSLVAHRIVSRMTMDVERGIRMQPAPSGTGSLDAYQHFVTAVSLLRQYSEGVNERARDHLDEALRLDPDFALAHAYRGLAEVILNDYSWASRSTLEAAMEHMQRGLQIAPEEARCHWIIGMTRLFMRQHASAELHLRRAIELNPSDPDMLAVMGYLETMRGRPEDGVALARRAMALNPLHPSWYHTDIATSLHAAGQYGEAIAHLQMLPRVDPFWHTRLAACHAALGDTAAAARHMAEAKKINPSWDPVEEYQQGLAVEHPESLEPILRDIELAVAAWRLHCG